VPVIFNRNSSPFKKEKMGNTRKPAHEITIEELDRELVIRGAQNSGEIPFRFSDQGGIPGEEAIMKRVKQMYKKAKTLTPNKELSHLDIKELAKLVMYKTRQAAPEVLKGRWDEDNRMDIYLVEDKKVQVNAAGVAAVCYQDSFMDTIDGCSIMDVKIYGEDLNLNDNEPFYHQPTAPGLLCTGFLVKDNILVTAGHSVAENNLAQLCFVFGFKMKDPKHAVTHVPNWEIYKGIEIKGHAHKRLGNKSDWALVKLDRKVIGHPELRLAEQEISIDEPVYVIGHPMGLPLKYSPGAQVRASKEAYFSADLDVYSRNSGSPVFNGNTHEVVGMVVRGDAQDFRWTGKDWISIIYPNPEFHSQEPECTRVIEFSQYCR
jgi:hypothetical protein